ncbi:MAG: D-tyrosyl-tRNA(Tyr) deacylase [Sulfolobales archaeon]|nr:D-tyrosyl-tRNA(Tyr) deacylase [Sulfolobales archaeon]
MNPKRNYVVDVEVVVSRRDAVGRVVKALGYDFREVENDVIDFEGDFTKPVVVISRHESSSGKPSLTVHTPGNPNDRTMGGRPRELATAFPRLMRSIFLEINNLDVSLDKAVEATHHGPTTLRVPIVFAEIGSSEEYWNNEKLVRKFVEAVLRGIDNADFVECNDVVTIFGGPHYSHVAAKALLSGDCVAHIISKHYVKDVEQDVINQAVEKSVNGVTKVIFDNVSKPNYERILMTLQNRQLKIQKL